MPPTIMSSSRDPTARLRAGLNPLLTASLGVYSNHNSNGTPLSALSISSHGPFSSAQTPVSAIQPYNPQEWISSPIAGPASDRTQHHPPTQPFHETQGECLDKVPETAWLTLDSLTPASSSVLATPRWSEADEHDV